MVKKYYAIKLGDAIKSIIKPLKRDPIIANLIKSWDTMPEWMQCLTPSTYTKQTKTIWLKMHKNENLLMMQYKTIEIRNIINSHLGYSAILNVKIKST